MSRLVAWQKFLDASSKLTKVKAETMVLYKNDDIIAINKPPGLSVHDGPSIKAGETLTNHLHWWQYDSATPPSLAHRLDKNTTGIMLLSRNEDSARRLARLFATRQITKRYCALCVSVPEYLKGSIKIPLGVKNISTVKKQKQMHRVVLRPDRSDDYNEAKPGGTLPGRVQLASTDYSLITQHNERLCSLLDVAPVTGFRHQIRVHLSDALLTPVIGDYKFAGPLFRMKTSLANKMTQIGGSRGFTRGPMYLHAYQLVIPSPDDEGKPLIITAPLPKYFVKTIESLELQIPRKYQKMLT